MGVEGDGSYQLALPDPEKSEGGSDRNTPHSDPVRAAYAGFLGRLAGLAHDFGLDLDEDPPTESQSVPPGLDRPEDGLDSKRGAKVPLYPDEKTGPSGDAFARAVFNLSALTGFDPRRHTNKGRKWAARQEALQDKEKRKKLGQG